MAQSQSTSIPSPVSLPPITYKGLPVITTEKLAEVYGCSVKNIQDNYLSNKKRFIEGKHFFSLTGQDLKDFRLYSENFGSQISTKVRKLSIWTESGSLYHAKSIGTDEAWAVYDVLVETFFRVVGKAPHLDRLSTSKDPERKELTAMINAWVGFAPIHYAGARAIVNAHIGVKTVDDMTVTQVKQAIQFVQGKINEAGQQALPQQALPSGLNPDALLEPHFLRIRSLIGEIRAEQEEIYTVVRQHRADVLKGNDARRSVLVNMHTTLDKLFYALDYSLDAAQVHAKGMCRMSQI